MFYSINKLHDDLLHDRFAARKTTAGEEEGNIQKSLDLVSNQTLRRFKSFDFDPPARHMYTVKFITPKKK